MTVVADASRRTVFVGLARIGDVHADTVCADSARWAIPVADTGRKDTDPAIAGCTRRAICILVAKEWDRADTTYTFGAEFAVG